MVTASLRQLTHAATTFDLRQGCGIRHTPNKRNIWKWNRHGQSQGCNHLNITGDNHEFSRR